MHKEKYQFEFYHFLKNNAYDYLIFRLHDEIEVINIWMLKVYNELITVRRKSHDDQLASIDNSLSCTERNPTATILYNLRTQCMFCGQGPKNEFDRLFECDVCQYAHYCSIECMEKYRAYHRYLDRIPSCCTIKNKT